MNETKVGDLRVTREDLEEIAKSFAATELKLEQIMRHAADPKEPRRAVLAKAAEAYTKVAQAKKLVLDVYGQLGVRPT